MTDRENVFAIKEMFFYADRLSNIHRYPMWDRIREMNVAEHSMRVTMLAMMMADFYNKDAKKKDKVNVELLMRKALLHDFEEALTGDIAHPIKHHSEEAEQFFGDLTDDMLVNKMFVYADKAYMTYVSESKAGKEGQIIAIADMAEILFYTYREVRLGNDVIYILLSRCRDYLIKMTKDTEFTYIVDLSTHIINLASQHVKFTPGLLEDEYGTLQS